MEHKDQEVADVTDQWDGCGCEECKKMGAIMRKLSPVLTDVATELRGTNHGLVATAVEQIHEILSMLSSVHISAMMQASDALHSSSKYVMERSREIQLQHILSIEVEKALKKVLVPIGSVQVEPGTPMPPGFLPPGQVPCMGCGGDDDDEDGGGGGPKLH